MKKKRLGATVWRNIILCILFLIWLNNTTIFQPNEHYDLLAHRGVAQTFDVAKVDFDTNTAEIIYPPEHDFLENTIPSMKAAFDYGATMVELDIKRTKDDNLAVFHDSTLSYRTDYSGEVADYTMEELKKADIGYGYTADDGKTYPFRGKGIGLMPTLDEVFAEFPNREFLVHVKDGDIKTCDILKKKLKSLSEEQLQKISVYGDDEAMEYLRSKDANLRLLSKKMLKKALLNYMIVGFTGYVPESAHNMEIHIPIKYAKFLWGWPSKFVERMEKVNTKVVIVEGDGKLSEGFDTLESLKKISPKYGGYVWTNRIDKIGK